MSQMLFKQDLTGEAYTGEEFSTDLHQEFFAQYLCLSLSCAAVLTGHDFPQSSLAFWSAGGRRGETLGN